MVSDKRGFIAHSYLHIYFEAKIGQKQSNHEIHNLMICKPPCIPLVFDALAQAKYQLSRHCVKRGNLALTIIHTNQCSD